jgi:pyruvate formate lyase activating enzyme
MNIGGFDAVVFSDYPGEPCSIIFTQGCNYQCPWCHNASLINFATKAKPPEFSITTILSKIDSQISLVKAVTICGGEPFCQKDLPELVGLLKARGLKVKLDTNGSFPDALKQLVSNPDTCPHFVAVDYKAPQALYAKHCGGAADGALVLQSIHYLRESGVPHSTRTTLEPRLTPQHLQAMAQELGTVQNHTWQPYKLINTKS